ncbi:MAG: OmpH family outer membrane protein [Flavobacteriales bacterium]|nr:OmpH family outer membrane protein [Flavobacteriales bacterium]
MKSWITLIFVFFATSVAFSQKFVYVNTELILESMPDYAEAQEELDKQSKKWQESIEAQFAEIESLYQAYKAEQILLTDELKKKREKEITDKETAVRAYQKEKFGVNGELFTMRQKLIKPLQDKIYDALKNLATAGNYAIIFDLASTSNILYSHDRYDKTDEVIKKLGYSK